MNSVTPNNAYAGQGSPDSPLPHSMDASVAAYSLGGVRIAPLLSAAAQLVAMYQNLVLARKYYDLNHADFNFWNGLYKDRMASSLDESKVRPFYSAGTYQPQFGQLDYLASTGRGQSKASLVIDKEWLNSRRKIGRYNVGHGRRVDYKYAIAKLNSELEGWNLGFRFEDNRKMLYDEQRHAHQAEILNLGIGAGNAAREGLATSTKWLSEARSQKAGIFGALSNGLSSYNGFQDARQNMYNREGRSIGPPKELAGSGDEIFSNRMGD